MLCPLCNQRKARRACPALGRQICAVCCGTKRLVEIRCPAECVYLASARLHPPAVVQRQHQRDVAALAAAIGDLNERQSQMFFLLATFFSHGAHQGHEGGPYAFGGLGRLVDDDVAEAAAAVAATIETAARGVIYEHRPASLPAQRLSTELQEVVSKLTAEHGSATERDAALVLRKIERGAREARNLVGGGASAYLDLLARVMREGESAAATADSDAEAPTAGPRLIVP